LNHTIVTDLEFISFWQNWSQSDCQFYHPCRIFWGCGCHCVLFSAGRWFFGGGELVPAVWCGGNSAIFTETDSYVYVMSSVMWSVWKPP